MSDLSNGESDQPLKKRIRGDPVTFQTRPVIGERNTERRNKNSNPTLITTEATGHTDQQIYSSGRTSGLFKPCPSCSSCGEGLLS